MNTIGKNETIDAESKLLRRVFRNLIRNAGEVLQNTSNPEIKIEVHSSLIISPRVEIFVTDNWYSSRNTR